MPDLTAKTEGFSLIQAVAIGVNTTSPAFSLAAVLAPMALLVGYATPIVLVISFVPMALTSLAFMYLNRRDSDCGTTFSWVARAVGPKSGFMAGWVLAAAGILVLGSLAETAITYGLLTFGLDSLAANRALVMGSSALLIVLMTGLAIVGSDSSIRLQTILTFVQVTILVIFGIAAAVLAVRTGLPDFTSAWINPFSQGVDALVAAMLLGVFAFWGWEAATNLSEECRDPSDAGKAGVLSTIILIFTYLLVAIFVVIYLGRSDFTSQGGSDLVLVNMSGSVFGPFAFLILVAVALSALASTQSTMVPGSRAFLSMARKGALPAKLGLTSPRFKSPWVALALLGGVAASWFLLVSSISEKAMLDTLSSLGILVAFYYSLTGFACVVYYRKHVRASVKGFILVGLGPTVGAVGLAFMLVVGVRSVSNPATSASGFAWIGLAPPLTIAALIFVSGLVIMLIRSRQRPDFFHEPKEIASHAQSPFLIGRELAIEPGGVLINCNATIEHVLDRVRASKQDIAGKSPVTMVFGIHPSGIMGEELEAMTEALIDDGHRVFTEVEHELRNSGVRNPIRLFEEEDSHRSVETATQLTQPKIVV